MKRVPNEGEARQNPQGGKLTRWRCSKRSAGTSRPGSGPNSRKTNRQGDRAANIPARSKRERDGTNATDRDRPQRTAGWSRPYDHFRRTLDFSDASARIAVLSGIRIVIAESDAPVEQALPLGFNRTRFAR